MFGIILSAINTVSAYVFSSLLLKFVLFTVLFLIASSFITYITGCGCIPTPTLLSGRLASMPSGVWYFLNLFGFAQGVTAIFSAYVARFLIRRIPFFG